MATGPANEVAYVDQVTGLMWEGEAARNLPWRQALARCQSLSYAGHDDWRLPQKNALLSLVNYSRSNPATDLPNSISGGTLQRLEYWTSSPRGAADGASVVEFIYGSSFFRGTNEALFARCVR